MNLLLVKLLSECARICGAQITVGVCLKTTVMFADMLSIKHS